jgi:hypothetical protein
LTLRVNLSLAKTTTIVNCRSARPPRLIQIDAPFSSRLSRNTRVSTEYGLDQEFNSLDAQQEAAEAYIRSQAHDGWTLVRTRYDDGGYSGGSTERPALQRLLADIRDRKVDIIVVSVVSG